MSDAEIVIKGAREHNLRGVDLVLPRNQLIAMTGVSGSGKSSLAFDTLYAEGQRRYVESLSSYARQFLGQMPKPEVDLISGLSPSISIQQKTSGRNPRSTVGTITEIYDYLRVLFARVGTGHCPQCDRPITAQTSEQILAVLLQYPAGTRYLVLAPLVQRQKGEYRDLFADLLKQGYLRARVDGRVVSLNENLQLDRNMRHTIEVVIDRLAAGGAGRTRLAEAVTAALKLGQGNLIIAVEEERAVAADESDEEGTLADDATLTSAGEETAEGELASDAAELPARPARRTGAGRGRSSQASAGGRGAGDRALATRRVLVDRLFSARYACTECGVSYEPPSPQLFSFNSPQGMCVECTGLGVRYDFDLQKLIPNPELSLVKGAVALLGPFKELGRWRRHLFEGVGRALELEHGLREGTVLTKPWEQLPPVVQRQLLRGTGDRNITYSWRHRGGVWKHGGKFTGILAELLEAYRKAKNAMRRRQIEKFLVMAECDTCAGARLNRQACHVRLTSTSFRPDEAAAPTEVATQRGTPKKGKRSPAGRGKAASSTPVAAPQVLRKSGAEPAPSTAAVSLSLPGVCGLTIAEAARFFERLELDATAQQIAQEALKEIRGRLGFLLRCGLDYLTLDRTAPTLSGGESQRIRLAGQIGCGLVGVLYILDEPSIGLHPRDNDKLLDSLLDLRDQGNTVIVVEHDEDTMRAADHVVDFGPGPGVRGGEVVAQGDLASVCAEPRSLTGAFLAGRERIEIRPRRPLDPQRCLEIRGAAHNNLKGVNVSIPLGAFVCVTGVSGSGKSSLVNDILFEALNRDLNEGVGNPGRYEQLTGLELLDKAIDIDQSPIGRTPRSNPATYVKLFDLIRDLYAQLPEAKIRGWTPGRFSFNVPLGRCEACEGNGSTRLEMDFLADVWLPCPVCNGNRFKHETLEVRFKGKTIAEVLDMDVQQALRHFESIAPIAKLLQTLHDVGLDYLKLGQPSPTLSGGEAQRVKLARELGKRSTGKTIYLLDEPTTGLHFADVRKLLEVLHGLVDLGNTVLVVEHNLDVIKTADWVIDMGPEGGAGGGCVLAAGIPETIAECAESHTGRALQKLLAAQGGPGRSRRSAARDVASRPRRTTPVFDTARPIVVQGASQHNLQNVDLELPRHQMSVFCGPSGSGKTSLAMDTLYAEGQRRYVESLSAYARQFLGQMPKPRVEHVSGLSPAIAIEQKTVGSTPRSTVGTVTEIYDYLRILFARLGQPFCPRCDIPVSTQSTDQVVAQLLAFPKDTRLLLLAPQEVAVGDSYDKLWERLRSQGYRRVRVNGETYTLDEPPELDRRSRHVVEIVIDRVTVGSGTRKRFAESVEQALDQGQGWLRVAHVDDSRAESKWRVDSYSLHRACTQCGDSFDNLTPNKFSFNSVLGWCPTCEGLGTQQGTDLSALVGDSTRTLADGGVTAWPNPQENRLFGRVLSAIAHETGLPLDVPFERLDARHKRIVLSGLGERWIAVPADPRPTSEGGGPGFQIQYRGLNPALEELGHINHAFHQRLINVVGEVPCPACQGSRLRPDAAAVRLADRTLQEVTQMPLDEALQFLKGLKLKAAEKRVAADLLREVTGRLGFLVEVGLDYLTLGRAMPTLSGGESQRIRLAGQVGRSLTGVLYVLDEPTIGLHPRDNGRLLQALRSLRDLGNTVLLVEHDREVLAAADRLYDFGPGAGRFGGTVTAQGPAKQLERNPLSLTGQYLGGQQQIAVPTERRLPAGTKPGEGATPGGGWLELLGASHHNLKRVDLRVPLGALVCVTGVSGSGKSSLVQGTLAAAVARNLHFRRESPGKHRELRGLKQIDKLIEVNQQPLGSTPASNPATYTGVFDLIREVYSALPESKIRGFREGRFSFNRPGGRCEACEGNGQKKIEMHFLPDVWVECDECRGKRFNPDTLAVRYRGQSIADVLAMSIGQAHELFENIPKIRAILATLCAVGLDYLTLGQSAATLSGGEAQRVKLAAELARPQTGRTLYILDEPTTGLHFDDIRKLLKVLHSLVAQKNTVVVIEHNLDVIKTADWLVDLGPEAGHAGGQVVAEGVPEDLLSPERWRGHSHTLELLAPLLRADPRQETELLDAQALSRKRAGDIEISQLGRDARMPWEVAGRQWHLQDRVSHTGQPIRWSGAALEQVIERLEQEQWLRLNFNTRSVVEATGGGAGWRFHALTGDEWILVLKFRVFGRPFRQERLEHELRLKSFNDLDELPIYNRVDRVRIKHVTGGVQEIAIAVHAQTDVQGAAFNRFLEAVIENWRRVAGPAVVRQTRGARAESAGSEPDAAPAKRGQSPRVGLQSADEGAEPDEDPDSTAPKKRTSRKSALSNVDKELPWVKLGLRWHEKARGFPSQKTPAWPLSLFRVVVDRLEQLGFKHRAELRAIDSVWFRHTAGHQVRLWTKRCEALVLELHGFELAGGNANRLALGAWKDIEQSAEGGPVLQVGLTEPAHLEGDLPQVLELFLKLKTRT